MDFVVSPNEQNLKSKRHNETAFKRDQHNLKTELNCENGIDTLTIHMIKLTKYCKKTAELILYIINLQDTLIFPKSQMDIFPYIVRMNKK